MTRSRFARTFVAGPFLLLAGLTFPAGPLAAAELGRPVLRHYTPGEHLHAIASPRVTQDAAGTMYFANAGDLLTYDGVRWGSIRLPTESAGVRAFTTADDGTIYLAGAGVIGQVNGTGAGAAFVSLREQLPAEARHDDEFRGAVALGRTVYFSSDQHLLIWRDNRFVALPLPTPPGALGARLHRVGDTVYVSALGHGLARFAGDTIESVADDPVLRENRIVSIDALADGALELLTAERGLFRLGADRRLAPLPSETNRWIAGRRVFRSLRLPDGSRVVAFSAVSGDGGMRFAPDGSYLGPLDTSIGLLVKTVRDFFVDREGGLWLGMDTGAARLEWPSAFSLFDMPNGLGQGIVTALCRHEGRLFAATSEGLFRLNPSDESGLPARFDRMLGKPVAALASHPAGLVALGGGTLFAQVGETFQPAVSLPRDSQSLAASSRDPTRVWIGTTRGLRSVRRTGTGWIDDGAVAGFTENCARIVETPDGALWVATPAHDLFRLTFAGGGSAPRVERFPTDAGIAAPAALAAWHATAGVRAVAAGPDALWVAGSDGIVRQPRNGGDRQRLPHLVDATVGPITHLLEENGPDGTVLWAGGNNGLARIEVAAAFPLPASLLIQLAATGVQPDGRLPPDHPTLTFRYHAARQRPTSSVTYRSRLVGLERDWSGWSTARDRSFPRLPSGDFRFEVQARDSDGVVSAPVSIGFVVQPHWWRSAWAVAGYAALGAALLAGVVRLRTRALRRHAARLESVVTQRTRELAERTAELGRQNTELVRLNRLELDEKVSARLAEEKARLEVLRYQLNPHFLFNTLASISSSLPADATTARSMVARLADFCRLTLHRPEGRDWTTLGEEIDLLRTYLGIEQSRWGELLDVAIDCDPTLVHEPLPHFLLLPLVENALKYGRATSPDRVGLRLAARRAAAGGLVLEVANTGEWIEPANPKTVASLGIGLDNLRERLARHYPRRHQLDIAPADGWVTVKLLLQPGPPA